MGTNLSALSIPVEPRRKGWAEPRRGEAAKPAQSSLKGLLDRLIANFVSRNGKGCHSRMS